MVENLGPGRHGDGNGLCLVVDPSGARRWIVRVVVKGQKNRNGGPFRTDFGLGGADVVTLNEAPEYRRMAKQGLHPRFHGKVDIPTFEEFAQQVHRERLPTWKNAKPKHHSAMDWQDVPDFYAKLQEPEGRARKTRQR